MGLHRAGFEVVGVDVSPQPEYPFEFVRADALKFPIDGFAFVWASPPCQAFTAYKRRTAHVRPRRNLIPATRARLEAAGVPYVIENVVGAPLIDPVMLCGSMFGLDVQRHRLFETSFDVAQPACRHGAWAPRFACATNRTNLRRTVEVGVWRIPLAVQKLEHAQAKLAEFYAKTYSREELAAMVCQLEVLTGKALCGLCFRHFMTDKATGRCDGCRGIE